MKDASNMSDPITRGDLQDEMKQLRSEIVPLVTRAELENGVKQLRWEMAQLATNGGLERLRSEMARMAASGELQAGVEELRREIALLATKPELLRRLELLRSEIQQAVATEAELQTLVPRTEFEATVAKLATKVELEMWGGALAARMDQMNHALRAEMDLREQRVDQRMELRFAELRQELRQELNVDLARHLGAALESVQTMIRGLDDKYTDLPPRVRALETAVFGDESS
jgi:hypothetical protein